MCTKCWFSCYELSFSSNCLSLHTCTPWLSTVKIYVFIIPDIKSKKTFLILCQLGSSLYLRWNGRKIVHRMTHVRHTPSESKLSMHSVSCSFVFLTVSVEVLFAVGGGGIKKVNDVSDWDGQRVGWGMSGGQEHTPGPFITMGRMKCLAEKQVNL